MIFPMIYERSSAPWGTLLDGRFDSTRPGRTLWRLFADQRGKVFGAVALFVIKQSPASLMPFAERLIQDALAWLNKGRTTLIVAHRFSTIRLADRIVVLQRGHIVETGTPQELLTFSGQFSRLASLQTFLTDN